MQHVNLAVVVAESGNKRLALKAGQIVLLLQVLHQGVALFFDVGKMAETGIALINIDLTNRPRPAKNVLIKVAMDGAQMRQPASRRAKRQRGRAQGGEFVGGLCQALRLTNTERIAHHIQAGIEVRIAVVTNFIAHSAS
ncbi:hypothetical protein D3C81_1775570 [compost metagenome]